LKLKLRWSSLAIEEFERGTDRIAESNPAAARRTAQRTGNAAHSLRDYP